MIIVSGCSWACGEWLTAGEGSKIIFPGLEYNFSQDGHECINLGIRAGSNLQVAHKVNGYITRNPDVKIDKIFIFQTEWTRDLPMAFEEDYDNIQYASDLQNIMISRFYHRLSEIAEKSNSTVYLIGGLSDTLWLDNMQEHYPGVEVLCQSLVNWLLNYNTRIQEPVYSWYNFLTVEYVKKIKKLLPDNEQQKLLDMVDQGLERESLVFAHPEYFWPDGLHPNRHVYKIMYKKILSKTG